MSLIQIYLDESGDLGWKFDQPYRDGGSSRYLTIASIAVSPNKKHLPKRLIKKLYKRFNWPFRTEKKWSDMALPEREEFAHMAAILQQDNKEFIRYLSITVRKENVQEHIRLDPNKLYNYMIGLSLLNEMHRHSEVTFIPDPRSVKVASGNSLHDYLQTQLWFEKQAKTTLKTIPAESYSNYNIQFADMLSGLVQNHFEDGNSTPWLLLRENISSKSLFF
ncbi:MAG: DUF3800 domain-containing protein [Deltaproteobacteria bacterium]|nr:DUF3800 domain-containing protein [Candidatus Tharpella aukensis]